METHQNKFLKRWTGAWIILTLLIVIGLAITALALNPDDKGISTRWVISTLMALFVIIYTRWAYQFWNKKFIEQVTFEERNKNPYRKIFFSGVNTLSIILLAVGIVGAIIMLMEENSDIYGALGLIIIVIWMVVFLRYFIWAVYFYNINYGITDKDWEKIFKAREDKKLGLDVPDSETKGPGRNPYQNQTFGLPTGTVRGMIAFTLLFGAISMLVISMGKDGEISENNFFWDHFEFFKTAFLMMIAFYFGDKSLKYLQKRWPSVQQSARFKSKKVDAGGEPDDDDTPDDETEITGKTREESNKLDGVDVSPTKIKKMLANDTDEDTDQLENEFVHIMDNRTNKFLTRETIEATAVKYKLEPAALKAVIEIESAGRGFLDNGKPKILFEGHKFWKWLEKRGKDPQNHISGNENILYKKWTREHYIGKEGEYERFHKACNIDSVAAVYSTSWGLFQILGENFDSRYGVCKNRMKKFNDYKTYKTELGKLDKSIETEKDELKKLELVGEIEKRINEFEYEFYRYDKDNYLDVEDFLDKIELSEELHLFDFFEFIKNKRVVNHNGYTGTLFKILTEGKKNQNYNWSAFAYGYNGSGYKTNNYHYKLQRAYEKYKKA